MDNTTAAFLAAFRGRTDVVPKLFNIKDDSGAVVRSGYSPICANFWTDTCPKKTGQKIACSKCSGKAYVPLSDALLQDHFSGKHILGVYPLLPDGTCWFLAADFDDHTGTGNPLPDVQAYVAAAKSVGFTPYVLRSKSGKGFHVYLFFATAVPAWKPRRVAFSLLQEAGLVGGDVSVNSFDRMFPNQDELGPTKPLGNLIGLPFQGEAVKQGNTVLLDPGTGFTAPLPNEMQISTFQQLKRITEADLDAIIAARGLDREEPRGATASNQLKSIAPATIPATIPQSSRNDTLFRLACSLHAKGLSDEAILQAIKAENAAKCTPPLDDGEVETLVQGVISHYQKGSGAPAPASTAAGAVQWSDPNSPGPALAAAIHSMLPDAPVSPQAIVPGKLVISVQRGIESIKDDGKGNQVTVRLFPVPIVLIARLKDASTGLENIQIAWNKDGCWQGQIVDRKTIADTRDVLSLANFGLPITSEDKEFVVRYCKEYELANQFCIPLIHVSDQLGWQQGLEAFLWGRNLVTNDGVALFSESSSGNALASAGSISIVFKGSDDGDEQVADGFHYAGDLDIWLAIANRAMALPTPMVILLAASAPPLLSIIGASNFVMETAGTTSTGKTTVQRLAASIWGCPDERAEASCLHTWDTTRVWVERVGGLLNGMPLILDDTKRLFASLTKDQARSMVNSVIYAYASGKGRGRGSVQGTQRTGAFRSVLISSGEQACTESSSDHGGARARVLSLWGPPFGTGDQSQLVKDINVTVVENFGFAGPLLVLHLLRNRDKWPAWKAEYRAAVHDYASLAVGDNVAGRLGEIFAVLEITAHRLLEAVPGLLIQGTIRDVLEGIWQKTVAGAAQDADRALAALRDTWDWTAANAAKFFGRHRVDSAGKAMEPHGGWLGRWDDSPTFDHVAYLGKPLRDRLEAFGYDAAATIRTWADRKWLVLDSKGRNQKSVRIDGNGVKAYCIPRRVFEVELGLDLTSPPSVPVPPSPVSPVSALSNPFLIS